MLEAVGHISFALGAVSYWVHDEIWLRSLLILSFATGLIYNAMPPVGPRRICSQVGRGPVSEFLVIRR